jgi:hypothetical protein
MAGAVNGVGRSEWPRVARGQNSGNLFCRAPNRSFLRNISREFDFFGCHSQPHRCRLKRDNLKKSVEMGKTGAIRRRKATDPYKVMDRRAAKAFFVDFILATPAHFSARTWVFLLNGAKETGK